MRRTDDPELCFGRSLVCDIQMRALLEDSCRELSGINVLNLSMKPKC